MKKVVIALMLAVSMVSMLASCTSGSSSVVGASSNNSSINNSSSAVKKIKIGVSLNNTIDFVTTLQQIMEEKASVRDDIELVFTNAGDSPEKQMSDVESLIAQKPDVIVLRAVDPDAGAACVEAVKNAGIYCVVQDTQVNTEEYDTYIFGAQSVHGNMIGSYIQGWLEEDSSRHAYMGYINGSANAAIQGRETGIYEVVDSDRITTLAQYIATGFNAEEAMATAEDWILSYPNMNVIACANDEMAIAVIQALTAAGKNFDDFLVFGVDGTEMGREYLVSGQLKATTYQDSYKTVDKLFEVCLGLVNGETYEKVIDPENVTLLTKENADA